MANERPDASVTEEELRKLPRWAVVAFAARCARRVQPLFEVYWPDAPREHVVAVDRAIALAEAACRVAIASSELRAAGAAAESASYGAVSATDPDDEDVAVELDGARASAASAAAGAAWTAHGAEAYVAYAKPHSVAARDTHRAAFRAAGGGDASDAYAHAARADYELLRALAKQHNWINDSPVDVALLGPLWRPGEAPKWATSIAPREDAIGGIKIRFEVPDSLSDEEAMQLINRHLNAISDMHAAMGGSDLRIIPPTEARELARVGSGVGA